MSLEAVLYNSSLVKCSKLSTLSVFSNVFPLLSSCGFFVFLETYCTEALKDIEVKF